MAQKTLDYVLTELQNKRGKWPELATKADVSYSWLTKLAQGKIPNPGLVTVDRLAKALRSCK
jgi:predicted transcriptional regulator